MAATAATSALLAPSAAAAWEEPELITSTATRSSAFALDSNARGDRILVWKSGAGFAFTRAAPGGAFGPPQAIGPTDTFREGFPRVELDERGNALLVWTYHDKTDPGDRYDSPCCDGLRARVIRRDGTLTRASTLAPIGSSVELVDMDIHSAGRIGVLFRTAPGFTRTPDDIQARFGTIAQGLGGRERVVRRGAAQVVAALSLAGSRARVIYPGGSESLTVVRELERVGPREYRPLESPLRTRIPRHALRFATASSGRQALLGLRPADQVRLHVYAATRERGRRFTLNRVATDQLATDPPTLAVEPAGNAFAAWGSLTPVPPVYFNPDRIASSLRRPSGVFDTAAYHAPLSGRHDMGPVSADVSATGRALFAWVEPSGEGRPGPTVTAGFRDPDGSTRDLQTLVTSLGSHTPNYAVAIDRAGNATFAYVLLDDLYVVENRAGG